MDQIRIIDRFREIPHEGPMADLVWSDPDPERDEFAVSPRGAGYTFGGQVVRKFLHMNNARNILRAHQLCQSGYQVLYDGLLCTVWSAPNYCYRCANDASILQIDEHGNQSFTVFCAAPGQESPAKIQQGQHTDVSRVDVLANAPGCRGIFSLRYPQRLLLLLSLPTCWRTSLINP